MEKGRLEISLSECGNQEISHNFSKAKRADLIWVFVEELYELLVEDAAASGVSHR